MALFGQQPSKKNYVYTSSEAVRVALQPEIPLHRPANPTGPNRPTVPMVDRNIMTIERHWGKPEYAPVIKPSYVRALYGQPPQRSLAPSYSIDQLIQQPSASYRAVPTQNQMKFHTSSARIKPVVKQPQMLVPYAQRSLSSPGPSSSMPHYNPLYDPHLQDYFGRKLGWMQRRHSGKTVRYKVTVRTGVQKTAGTAANIFLRMIGSKGKFPKQRLAKRSEMEETADGRRFKFRPGSHVTFNLTGPHIGSIESIIVENDGLERKDGWFLEDVVIQREDSRKSKTFPCNQWLSLFEGDGHNSRHLYPIGSGGNRKLTDYEIETVTGTKRGAGTDSHVFITLYGDKGATPRHNLSGGNNADPFEKGQKDVFSLPKTVNVGKLTKLRIEHDNTGRAPGWFLDHVTVVDKETGTRTDFACNQWLAKDEADGRISRDLVASGSSSGAIVNFEITTQTADRLNGGTDANVFVTLFGENGSDSGEVPLKGSGNLFERGAANKFTVPLPGLGALKSLRVRHDNSGSAPGWFLVKVDVTDSSNGKTYSFPCNRWLAKDEDDGQISRDLHLAGKPGGAVPYTITTITGDVRGAGTDSEVYVIMNGPESSQGHLHDQKQNHHAKGSVHEKPAVTKPVSEHSSGKIILKGGKFERGKKDVMQIESGDLVSPLTGLTIGHDDSGAASGWFLEEVIVFCPNTGVEQHFPCKQWLATDEGDGLIERNLSEAKHLRKTKEKLTPWDVFVHTSDLRSAGTNSNVSICLYGENGKSEDILLEGKSDKFERGNVDQFLVETPNIGKPYKMRVWHDNAGSMAGWHLDKIEAVNRVTGRKYEFPCNRWLADDEDDGETVRELPAHGEDIKKPLQEKYAVQVQTADKRGAGTDANVFACLFGKHGDTGDRKLAKSSSNKNKFEKGKMDEFVIEAVDLGKLEKLRIGHGDSGSASGWFLDKVIVKPMNQPKDQVSFSCGRWLASDEDDGKVVRELFVGGQSLLNTTQYQVSVRTGDVRNAGTDANVYLEIYGERGDSGRQWLKQSENSKKLFERARTDLFNVEIGDIGKIKRIKIGHDGKGLGDGWFLDGVEIKVPSKGELYKFTANRWLDAAEDDGELEVELMPSQTIKQDATVPYELVFTTGDEKNAGTDASVFIQIYGEKIKTEIFNLRNRTDNFERAAVDKFKIEAENVGKIMKVRVGHDGKGMGSGWFLEKVLSAVKIKSPRDFTLNDPFKLQITKPRRDPKLEKGRSVATKPHHPKAKHSASDSEDSGLEGGAGRHGNRPHDTRRPSTTNRRRSASRHSVRFSGSESENESDVNEKHRSGRRHDGRRGSTETHDKHKQSNEKSFEEKELETYTFNVHRWFDKREDDGQIVRELVPNELNGKALKGAVSGKGEPYEIHIFTSDCFGAGTDANVFINVYGEHGDTGDRELKQSQNRNKFERGQEDVFSINAANLGRLTKVRIGHDNSGSGAAWHLDRVEIKTSGTKEHKADTYVFPCAEWFDASKGDGQISRELVAISASNDSGPKGKGGSQASLNVKGGALLESRAKMATYNVRVTTGKERGAGTDANVFIVLHGTKQDTGQLLLKHSQTNKNKFEAGNEDEFIVEANDIGDLKKIIIGHDNAGGFADWFLDCVDIDAPALGKTWHFACGRWIGKDVDDGLLQRELFPEEKQTKSYKKCLPHEFTVYTSDMRNAGTDADVYVKLIGKNGDSSRQASLCVDKSERKEKFERGSVDKFIVELEDVGQIERLRIGHDNAGIGAGWHLDKVELRKLLPNNTGTVHYVFPCKNWFDKKEGDGLIERDLKPESVKEERSTTAAVHGSPPNRDGSLRHHDQHETPPNRRRFGDDVTSHDKDHNNHHLNNAREYEISVHTGSEPGSASDAQVFISLEGSHGRSDRLDLNQKAVTSRHKNLFEQDQVDVFRFKLPDLGDINVMDVSLIGSKPKDDWFLEKVEITDLSNRRSFVFNCNRWFSKVKDDGKTDRTFYAKGYDSSKGRASNSDRHKFKYLITIFTGDVKDGGTDAPIWLTLRGSDARGRELSTDKPIWLKDAKGRPIVFRAGEPEKIEFEAPDVGDVKEIEIGIDYDSKDDSWFVDRILLEQPATPTENVNYAFSVKEWFSEERGDGKIKRRFAPNKKWIEKSSHSEHNSTIYQKHDDVSRAYELEITTGSRRGAETSNDVMIILSGQNGKTDELLLENSDQKPLFRKGETNSFKLNQADLGELRSITVGHVPRQKDGRLNKNHRDDDDSELDESWYCERIVLHDRDRDISYVFDSNAWIPLRRSRRDDVIIQCSEIQVPDSVASKHRRSSPPTGHHHSIDDARDTSHSSEHRNSHLSPRHGHEAKGQNEKTGKAEYEIIVYTGDERGAGTDANVSVNLIGSKGESGKFKLSNPGVKNLFERSSVDKFSVELADLGSLKRLQIEHDDTGWGSAWLLDKVEVIEKSHGGQKSTFKCGEWFDKKKGDGKIARELRC